MAYEIPVNPFGTVPAAGSLANSQFLGITMNASGQGVVQTTQGGPIIGVLQNNPNAAGQALALERLGITKMVAGAALATPGIALMVDASGRCIPQTGTNVTIGRLLDTASGAGVLCTVALIPN